VTILTGFLGAGKTTLLNQYLSSSVARGTAVLINEFGDTDIDGPVIEASMATPNRLMSLPNGCVCCEVQEDLAAALLELSNWDGEEVQRGIIETTGLADPGAILRMLAHDPRLREAVDLSQTICVCAAPTLRQQTERFAEAAEQIALADKIVVSKTDLVDKGKLDDVISDLTVRNPLADIVVNGPESSVAGIFTANSHHHPIPEVQGHRHSHGLASFSVGLQGSLDKDRFRDVMSFWIMRHAERLLRMKGIVSFADEKKRCLVNGVHDVFTSQDVDLSPDNVPDALVFIGIDLPEKEIRKDVLSCLAPASASTSQD
jgi:G3E family GTPase